MITGPRCAGCEDNYPFEADHDSCAAITVGPGNLGPPPSPWDAA